METQPQSGGDLKFGGLRLGLVALVWLAVERCLALYLGPALPPSIGSHFSMASWMVAVESFATLVGLGTCALLMKEVLAPLGLKRPGALGLGAGALLAPLVFLLALYIGFEAAFDTLVAELRAGGARRVAASLGSFGSAVRQASFPELLLWLVVIAPVTEELMFRGALWGAASRLGQALGLEPKPGIEPPAETLNPGPTSIDLPVSDPAILKLLRPLGRNLLAGLIPTLVVTVVFALLHSEYSGGLGIQRSVGATVLALCLCIARQASGRLWAPLVLHMSFNLLSIASDKRWLVSETFPKVHYVIPSLLIVLAGVGVVLIIVLHIIRRALKR